MTNPTNTNFLEFAKPFIDAAKSVFETMIFTKLEPKKPCLKENNISKGEISSLIGLSGTVEKDGKTSDFKSMFVMSWPEQTYVKVASSMLGEEHTEYSDEITDVGAEITNMIVGNAKRQLCQIGYNLDMAIPSIVHGKNHKLSYPSGTNVILMPINSGHGEFYMEICYKD